MKRALALALSLLLVLALAACGGTPASSGSTPAASTGASEPAAEGGYEIAMITDKGNIDDKSFNQGTWEGVQMYAEANGMSDKIQYYKPTEVSDDAYLATIDLAVQGGAKIVVTPGFLFLAAVTAAQDKYPDVRFVFIDADASFEPAENSVGVMYAEEQAGYLAGYASVMDGHTNLGFMGGMAVPAVVRYGFGYVQGANDAANELGVEVKMNYFYTGGFEAAPEWQTMASGWYNDGTTVIFGCGGSVGNSVFAAAEATSNKAIGVDVDQAAESETIITSAMKGLRESVNLILTQFYADEFPGGQMQVLGAAEDAVGLPMATSRFETFSQEDYDVVYDKIATGEITILGNTDVTVADSVSPADLPSGYDKVTINYIEQ